MTPVGFIAGLAVHSTGLSPVYAAVKQYGLPQWTGYLGIGGLLYGYYLVADMNDTTRYGDKRWAAGGGAMGYGLGALMGDTMGFKTFLGLMGLGAIFSMVVGQTARR